MSTADTGTRGSRPGELHRRRVLLLAESAGLAAVLNHLLDPSDRLSRLGSLRELAESRALENTDVVVLDVPAEDRAAAVGQIRRRYLGPLVVLGARGDDTGLRLDDACTLVARPFSADELGAALATLGRPGAARPMAMWTTDPPNPGDRLRSPTGGPDAGSGRFHAGPAPVTAGSGAGATAGTGAAGDPMAAGASTAAGTGAGTPAGTGAAVADPKAAARQAPFRAAPAAGPGRLDLVERLQRLLITLTQGWHARRRVRVAGFSAFALIAFTVAFALAAQGRCGPGCDAFGTGFSPEPTIAASESSVPSTTGPKGTSSTTTPAGSPGTGAFRGISGGRLGTTSTTERRATTTTRKPPATTRPATTRPATTQSTTPPTTAPPTTAAPTTQTTAGA